MSSNYHINFCGVNCMHCLLTANGKTTFPDWNRLDTVTSKPPFWKCALPNVKMVVGLPCKYFKEAKQ